MSKQKCQTPYCRKSAYVEPRGHVRLYCVGCSSKKWKAAHPYSYHFNALRNNAKRRGKEFTLTLDEYTEFAIANGLFDPNGKKFYNKTIDRRRNNEGYHAGNLQMLTRVENSRKRYVDYYANQFNDMDT